MVHLSRGRQVVTGRNGRGPLVGSQCGHTTPYPQRPRCRRCPSAVLIAVRSRLPANGPNLGKPESTIF